MTWAEQTTYWVNLTGFENLGGFPLNAPTQFWFTTGDFTAPTIISTNPPDTFVNVVINAGTYIINFNESMNTGVTAVLTNLPGATPSWADADTFQITYTTLAESTLYYVDLTGQGHQDLAGLALTGDMHKSFTTGDFTAPTATPNPANTTTGVSTSMQYVITCNETMNTAVGSATVQPAPPFPGAWGWNATGWCYNYTGMTWAEQTTYWVNLTGFTDLAGNPLPNYQWNFTTGDFTNPTIISSNPADGATGISVAAGTLVVNFSEPMDNTSGTPANLLTNLPPSATPPAWNAGFTNITITYNPLADATIYYFNVENVGLTDLASRILTGDRNISFTTGDFTGPTATPTPTDGAADVAVNIGTYTIKFSEPMQAVGIPADTIPTGTWGWTNSTHYEKTGITPLEESTKYNVVLDNTFLDLAGNPVTGDITFNFTTEDNTNPIVYNLTVTHSADVSVNNPTIINASINEMNFAMVGLFFMKSIGGNATLDNYTDITSFDSSAPSTVNVNSTTGIANVTNMSFSWGANAPQSGGSMGAYLTNGTLRDYVSAAYWNEAGTWAFGMNVYFTNWTYNISEEASIQFYLTNGTAKGLFINGSGQAEWVDPQNFEANATIQLRIEVTSFNKTTRALVTPMGGGGPEIPYGNVYSLRQVQLVPEAVVPSGNYIGIVVATDASGNLGFNMTDLSVDNTAPTIALNSPANNSMIKNGTIISLTVTETNINRVYYLVNTNTTQVNLTAPYNIDTTGWADGQYTITVHAIDVAKNEAIAQYVFTLDSTLPAIILNSPADGARIMPGTILDFSVTDTHLSTVNYSVNSGTLENFTAPYDIATTGWADATYAILVRANDTAGNIIDRTFSFTVDGTAPTVVSLLPSNGTEGVAPDTTVVVTFSEPMNNVSVQGAITTSPNIANLGFGWNANNTVLTITPPANLTQDTQYTVTVGTGAEDMAGNNLAAANSTSFTTLIVEVVVEDIEIIIGPVLDADGNPISGAAVTVTFDGNTYTGTTDANGNATITLPETALGEEIAVNITKTGYDPISYTATLAQDGIVGQAPPTMNPAEEGTGTDYTMIIIIVVVIIIIIGILAFIFMRKPPTPITPAPAKEAAKPPTKENTPQTAKTPEQPKEEPKIPIK